MRRYAYFYFMKEDLERVQAVAPRHADHWHGYRVGDYLGGPFGDRSGGLITFSAEGEADAEPSLMTHS